MGAQQAGQRGAYVILVFCQQNRLATAGRLWRNFTGLLLVRRRLRCGNDNPKRRAAMFCALDFDGATVLSNSAVRHGETKPGATLPVFRTEERLEDALADFSRHAHAGVGYGQDHVVPWRPSVDDRLIVADDAARRRDRQGAPAG